jgi:hypothetical protein
VIDDLLAQEAFGVHIVVNDGSSPEKAAVFEELVGKGSLTILTHAVNPGKGRTLKTGLNQRLLSAPGTSKGSRRRYDTPTLFA